MFITIIVVLLMISFLVTIHEFGHYITARKFGMKVEEFAIGMGPVIFKHTSKKSNIIYSLRCMPIGGFCRIKGEDGGNDEEDIQKTELKIEGEEINKENPEVVKPKTLDEDSFGAKKIWQRAIVLFAGVFMNFVFAIILIYVGLVVGMPDVINPNQDYSNAKLTNQRMLISSVLPGSMAEKAGIKTGNDLITLNGEVINDSKLLNEKLQSLNGINLTIKDSTGKEKQITNLNKEFNKDLNKEIFGLSFTQIAVISYNPLQAIPKTFQTTIYFVKEMFGGLGYMVSSIFSGNGLPEGLSGPIGITFITKEAITQGISYVLYIIAQISLNLAIINIIPFPALDGGRILFLAFEKIKGKPLNEKFELIANGLGFLLLM
ncbi:MAG: site-2 protease family protein, partial [Patescibacteria group bacterium]